MTNPSTAYQLGLRLLDKSGKSDASLAFAKARSLALEQVLNIGVLPNDELLAILLDSNYEMILYLDDSIKTNEQVRKKMIDSANNNTSIVGPLYRLLVGLAYAHGVSGFEKSHEKARPILESALADADRSNKERRLINNELGKIPFITPPPAAPAQPESKPNKGPFD